MNIDVKGGTVNIEEIDDTMKWFYEKRLTRPKSKPLQIKYENKYKNKIARQGGNFHYTPNLSPAKKRGLLIKNGLDPKDTVIIAIAIYYIGKWQTWKFGFSPEVSHPYVRFKFANGDIRKLHYKNVWQYLQDHYIGKETPEEDYYLDKLSKYYKVPFPALEEYDASQSRCSNG